MLSSNQQIAEFCQRVGWPSLGEPGVYPAFSSADGEFNSLTAGQDPLTEVPETHVGLALQNKSATFMMLQSGPAQMAPPIKPHRAA